VRNARIHWRIYGELTMLADKEEEQRYGVWAALGVIALVIALVLGVAIRQLNKGMPSAVVKTADAAAGKAEDMLPVGEALAKVYFASGQAAMPLDTKDAVVRVVDMAKNNPGKTVLISGFHDSKGDPAKNAELAKERAKSVRDALRAAGVEDGRILLRRPEVTTGSGDLKEARRVEVRVQ
jgi:outer membrane protein OmpA-like peptidoglycan-associated protein